MQTSRCASIPPAPILFRQLLFLLRFGFRAVRNVKLFLETLPEELPLCISARHPKSPHTILRRQNGVKGFNSAIGSISRKERRKLGNYRSVVE
ncbi:hypothetical protein RB195_024307 [Necator americanus]|uniref:Uncharacterized protein n=1 Tax=Necator americanus TaxID=51031 RepID=A0ABR1EMM1_NECAM